MNETASAATSGYDAVLDVLVAVGQMIEQRMEEAVQAHGLSLAKMGVLHALVQTGEPVPLGVLSRELHCVKSNITQLIDRMEVDKLVRRIPDPDDRRSVRAELTAEGRRRYDDGWQALEQARREILGALSERDREQLLRLVGRIREGRSD
jgi:DNA-binding MarR family transcriptional regulator